MGDSCLCGEATLLLLSLLLMLLPPLGCGTLALIILSKYFRDDSSLCNVTRAI